MPNLDKIVVLLQQYADVIRNYSATPAKGDDLSELVRPEPADFFDGFSCQEYACPMPSAMDDKCMAEKARPRFFGAGRRSSSRSKREIADAFAGGEALETPESRESDLHYQALQALELLRNLHGAEALDELANVLDDELLAALRYLRRRPSRLVIDERYRILLPDYGNIEIAMSSLSKALYLLFLRHPEGIRLKCMSDYQTELTDIYLHVSNRSDRDQMIAAVDALCQPFSESLRTTFSRMNQAFRKSLQADVAEYYTVNGENGEPRKIELPAELITM